MNQADPLQQLHDIVEAQPIDWWPLAFGWWLLLLVCLFATVLAVVTIYKRHAKYLWKREAGKELLSLETRYFKSTPDLTEETGQRLAARLNSEVSVFLKRVLSSAEPSQDFRAQGPEVWRKSLDQFVPVLSEREKTILAYGQYTANAERLDKTCFEALRKWLKGLR